MERFEGAIVFAQSGLDDHDFGGPLFLAAPPVELGWKRRVKLFASSSEAEGYRRLLAAARGQNGRDAFDETQFGAIGSWLSERLGTRGVPITLSLRAGMAVAPADADMAELMRVDTAQWQREADKIEEYFRGFDRLPDALREQLGELRVRVDASVAG